MNQMNMAGFNPAATAIGSMSMPANGPNGAPGRMIEEPEDVNMENKLNAYIYSYLCHKGHYETARAFKDSGALFDPPLEGADVNGDVNIDSKDGVDMDRPKDLPFPNNIYNDGQGGSFLQSWFSMFWDIYCAQRRDPKATPNANLYVQHTQQQARLRQSDQGLFNRMGQIPNGMEFNPQMMGIRGMPDNLRQRAMQNNNGGRMPATPQQLAQMHRQQMQQMQQQAAMRGDRDMDMNGQRPRTPSGGDHAPSPSKRQRMEGVPYGAQQMMLNGRGAPGMPGQVMGGQAMNAGQLLEQNGINPGMDINVNEFYNGANPTAMQMRGAPAPNVTNGAAGGNHALQDYQMQLMLLEQQNKKRLLMARQEQDGSNRPNDGSVMPPGAFAPGMSPSGSRGGPSPGPNDRKAGTPKMNQVGMPGSPLPDGSMRESPAGLNFQVNPDVYQQMNGNLRPPNSHPAALPQQQMDHFTRQQQQQARMQAANGVWPPGSQPQMMGQPQQQQQPPPQVGTPQQRNEMPPPQAPSANGRPASPVQPSPQTTTKAAPKGKKKNNTEPKAPKKKNSMASASGNATATTSAEEPAPSAPTPTPQTPVTPQHTQSFAPKNEPPAQPALMQGITTTNEQVPQAQPDPNMQIGYDNSEDFGAMNFSNEGDLLENFDFEQFLNNGEGDLFLDAPAFDAADIETAIPGGP